MNEGLWLEAIPDDVAAMARDLGTEVLTAQDWRSVWESSGLHDRVVKVRRVDPGVEIRSRMRWIGLRWLVRAWSRAAYLWVRRPDIRHSFKAVASGTKALDYWGYGLFVGQK